MDITVTSIMGGPDIKLITHWLAHYRSLGLDQFVVAVNDPERASEYDQYLIDAGITPAYHLDGLFHEIESSARVRLNEMVTSGWVIHPDLDELIVFDRPLEALLEDCVIKGYLFVPGRFIDHVQAEGDLVAVQAEPSLWQQFPLMHHVTFHVRRGCTTKMVLRRRDFPVTVGNHVNSDYLSECHPDWQEVHHFRWTATTVPSLKRLIAISPDYPFCFEWENILSFLGDLPRLDLDRLRELAPFLDPSPALVRYWGSESC